MGFGPVSEEPLHSKYPEVGPLPRCTDTSAVLIPIRSPVELENRSAGFRPILQNPLRKTKGPDRQRAAGSSSAFGPTRNEELSGENLYDLVILIERCVARRDRATVGARLGRPHFEHFAPDVKLIPGPH